MATARKLIFLLRAPYPHRHHQLSNNMLHINSRDSTLTTHIKMWCNGKTCMLINDGNMIYTDKFMHIHDTRFTTRLGYQYTVNDVRTSVVVGATVLIKEYDMSIRIVAYIWNRDDCLFKIAKLCYDPRFRRSDFRQETLARIKFPHEIHDMQQYIREFCAAYKAWDI